MIAVLKKNIFIRVVVVYLIVIILACILTEVVWGGTGGILIGTSIARDKEYQQKVTSFLKERGINPQASKSKIKSAINSLPPKDKRAFLKLGQGALANLNWFYIALFVSLVVFALVGFLSGIWSRTWLFAGVIPISTFFTNNPIIRFHYAKDLALSQKTIVVILQFVTCYLLAYYGAKITLRRYRQKERAIQTKDI